MIFSRKVLNKHNFCLERLENVFCFPGALFKNVLTWKFARESIKREKLQNIFLILVCGVHTLFKLLNEIFLN